MKSLKFLKIDKDTVLEIISGNEINARIGSFVEQILTFNTVRFLVRKNGTVQVKSWRGSVKDFIKEIKNDTIWIPEVEFQTTSEYDEIAKKLNNNPVINETETGFTLETTKKCKFTITYEEDGKVIFNETVTEPDKIDEVIEQYLNVTKQGEDVDTEPETELEHYSLADLILNYSKLNDYLNNLVK